MDKYCCYKCNLKMPKEDLERVFVAELRKALLDEKKLNEYADKSEERAAEKELLGLNLENERKKARKRMETLIELYQNEGIDLEGFKEQYKPLELRVAEIGEELPKLDKERRMLLAERASHKVLREGGLTLADEWPSLPIAKKREVVETIVTSIVIEGDSVAFNLAFDLKDFCKKSTQWSG